MHDLTVHNENWDPYLIYFYNLFYTGDCLKYQVSPFWLLFIN